MLDIVFIRMKLYTNIFYSICIQAHICSKLLYKDHTTKYFSLSEIVIVNQNISIRQSNVYKRYENKFFLL